MALTSISASLNAAGNVAIEPVPDRRALVLLLLSVCLITVPHAWHIPLPLSGFFGVLAAWRAMTLYRERGLPSRVQLTLLTLLAIALLVSQQRSFFGRDAGTAVFVVALGLKLLETRSRRDAYLVVNLAFIVAASQFLYQQSLWMAGYVLLVFWLLLATLLGLYSVTVPIGRMLKTGFAIAMQALPLALLMFVFFPRVEAPRWMWLQDQHKAVSGLTDRLEPGSISELSLSEALVFRARFDGAIPPPARRYWRGPVYVETDGSGWRAVKQADRHADPPEIVGDRYEYTMLMEPQTQTLVYGLEMAESFGPELRRNRYYQLQVKEQPLERAEYRIVSGAEYRVLSLSAEERRQALQLPQPVSARLRDFVAGMQRDAAGPQGLIDELLRYFRTENFYYTLTPPLMPDQPVETFLFETRRGFCSHYATALVYLLRIAGVPARVVGGYQGGEINPVGNFLEVRQADAHAWAEAWMADKGWVRVDPTAAVAPERIERGVNVDLQIASGEVSFSSAVSIGSAGDWLKRSRQLLQSIDYNWQRWVINYNSENQAQFFRNWGIDGALKLAQWLFASLLLVGLPVTAWILKTRVAADQSVQCYRQFCRKMAKAGVEIGFSEGALAFAERAAAAKPELAEHIEQITALYLRIRYQAQSDSADLRSLKNKVRGLRI